MAQCKAVEPPLSWRSSLASKRKSSFTLAVWLAYEANIKLQIKFFFENTLSLYGCPEKKQGEVGVKKNGTSRLDFIFRWEQFQYFYKLEIL